MRKSLPLILGTILLAGQAFTQQADRFAYAITDAQPQGPIWQFLRKLDLQTGQYSQVLLSGNDASFLANNLRFAM